MKRKVLIAVGGSGGHLLPAQQLASKLRDSAEILFAGLHLSKSPFFQKESFSFLDIEAASTSQPLRFLYKSGIGIGQSLKLISSFRPDVVVGFGSFHSFPVLAAAVLLRKPIVLYEANCKLGKVNRLFFPFAKLLGLQFPLQGKKISKKHQFVSYFPWIKTAKEYTKEEARAFYGLGDSLPICLVFGGSQGASFLNETAPESLQGFQVIHCAGKGASLEEIRSHYEKKSIRAFVQHFESDMDRAYRAADFALCRSGAATISELITHVLPAVLVPYPHAADQHQRDNAKFFCDEVQGGLWIEQNEPLRLRSAIELCLERLESFRQSIRLFYQKTEKRVELADLVRSLSP